MELPDIILEVLSAENERQAGVTEYFTVNPENCATTCWSREYGIYEAVYTDRLGIFKSSILDLQFEFDYDDE
jgi:Uma2 family endonuclease